MDRRSVSLAIATAAVVLVACVVGWWVLRAADDASPGREAVGSASTAGTTSPAAAVRPERGPCDPPATEPFTPHRIAVEDVGRAEVVGVARDSRGVTGVLPISNRSDVAWDLGGVRPGSRRGNVLLNTHTWPDGSALGNALLDRLGKGDRVVLHGSNDARLCYRVTRRLEVAASEGYPPYYRTDGPPQVAIIVCSGTRSSAGEWSHRTIWFARAATAGRDR